MNSPGGIKASPKNISMKGLGRVFNDIQDDTPNKPIKNYKIQG